MRLLARVMASLLFHEIQRRAVIAVGVGLVGYESLRYSTIVQISTEGSQIDLRTLDAVDLLDPSGP